ncbi:hypothetical protein [Thalassobacterium sedimentorum]|uniref:hypothetical protein n=1 Tax=Thalassobacterium sedimentorum TaxID=3041258 RepID=UPI002810D32C|nr:hypothetical protein [Coraliomargarita sp. SDUM461004]
MLHSLTPIPINKKFSHNQGFALIIALGLMAFVLLLLLSITTFIQVESQSSANQESRMRAQQNALLGLQIALGNLQSMTGADTRITASAEIVPAVAQAAEASPQLQGGNRHWTGAWQSDTGVFLGYLTSGYEDATDENTLKDFSADFDVEGNLTTGTNAKLVGGGSADVTAGYIAAPKENLTGLEDNSVGNYAWWVGDLGTRAQVHFEEVPTRVPAKTNEFVFYPSSSGAYSLFSGVSDASVFAKAASWGDMDLALEAGGLAAPSDSRKSLFYDLTTTSMGLLTNTKQGGLLKNLNAAFEGQMAELINYHGDDQVFGSQLGGGDDFGGPKWTQLQNYYNLPDNLTGSDFNASISARKMTDDEGAIAPVLLHMQYAIHASILERGGDQYGRRLHVFPLFSFWNPYDVTLKGGTYYYGWMKSFPQVKIVVSFTDSTGSQTLTPTNPLKLNSANYALKLEIPDLAPGETVVLTPSQNASKDDNISLTPGDRDTYIHWDLTSPFTMLPGWSELEISLIGEDNSNYSSMGVALDAADLNYNTGTLDDFVFFMQDIPVFGHKFIEEDSGISALTFTPADPYPETTLPDATYLFQDPSGSTNGPLGIFMVRLRQPDLAKASPKAWEPIRWLANFNPRASAFGRAPQELQTGGHGGFNAMPSYLGAFSNDPNAYNDFRVPQVGLSPVTSPDRTVLYALPRTKEDVTSIGDLRHANISMPGIGDILQKDAYKNIALDNFRPAYVIGESLADPRLLSNQTFRNSWPMSRDTMEPAATHYDWSYLINEALYDSYYLSTVTKDWLDDSWDDWAIGDDFPELPNSRLKVMQNASDGNMDASDWKERLADIDAARNLYIDGAFNINSTSVAAWTALLRSFTGMDIETDEDGTITSSDLGSAFLRSQYPKLGDYDSGPFDSLEAYAGFRRLTEVQVAALAMAIVDEVKARGPFYSLADFVNRDPDASISEHRLKGALQAAVDASGVNDDLEDSNYVTTVADYDSPPESYAWFDDYNMEALAGPLLQGIPGFLSQGDLISRLGIVLRPRSDSFIIRAYGDTVTLNEVASTAVCEAVVQRVVEPVNASVSEPLEPAIGSIFGRQYRIVSFRWLSEEEI